MVYLGCRYIGELQLDEVIERPAEHPAERRFAFDEGRRSEYFTVSEAGIVKYFSWDGSSLPVWKRRSWILKS